MHQGTESSKGLMVRWSRSHECVAGTHTSLDRRVSDSEAIRACLFLPWDSTVINQSKSFLPWSVIIPVIPQAAKENHRRNHSKYLAWKEVEVQKPSAIACDFS